MSFYRYYFGFLKKREKFNLLLFLIIMILNAFLTAIIPYILKIVIDVGTQGEIKNLLIYSCALILMLIVFSILDYFGGAMAFNAIINNNNKIRKQIVENIIRGNIIELDRFTSGEFINRFSEELDNTGLFIIKLADGIVNGFLKFPLMIIMCFLISWQITIMILIAIPLVLVVSQNASNGIDVKNKEKQIAKSKLTTALKELLDGKIYVRFFEEKNHYRGLDKHLNEYFTKEYGLVKKRLLANHLALNGFIQFVSIVIVCFSTYLVSKKIITVGSITAMFVYVFNIWTPVGSLLSLNIKFRELKTSIKRIKEILNISREEPEGLKINKFESINLKNVSLLLENKTVLNKINMNIENQDKIAIVGESGSGKTTLLKLISGLYSEYSGEIFINKENKRELNIFSYWNKIAYITSEPFFFNGTIKRNMFINDNNLKVFKDLTNRFNLNEKLDNINKEINEKGSNFSSGEKVRMDIIRNIMMNKEIFVMDEPFARLDKRNINELMGIIRSVLYDKTIIISTHIFEPVKSFNKIYNINYGKLTVIK